MKRILFALCFSMGVLGVNGQDSLSVAAMAHDSLTQQETSNVENLSTNNEATIETQVADSLLPSRYMLTQRWLWGENGLKRKNGKFPLTLEGREHEMDIRATMNKWHRIAGYTALACMVGSGISGQMLANGNDNARNYHQIFTGVTNISYFGSLALGIFAPPPMRDRDRGFTKVNVHRTLAIVHVASMITTNILAEMLPGNKDLIPYHRAAAITAFSSLFAASIVINF